VLSLLLHALLVVVFGTPAGGGAAAGWRNPLSVKLRSRVPDTDALVRASPGEALGRAGPAFPRSAPPAPPAPPSASARSRAPLPAAAPEPSPYVQPPPTLPEAAAPAEDVLPRLNPGAPVEVDKSVVPQVQIVPQDTKPTPAPAARAPRREAARPTPTPAAPRPDLPIGTLPPQDLPTPRAVETASPHPVEPPKATVLQGDTPQRVEREAAPPEPQPVTPPEPKPVAPPVPMPQLPPPPQIDLTPELVPLPAPTREPIPQLEDVPALRTMPDIPQQRDTHAAAPAPVVPAPPVIVPAPAPVVPAPPVIVPAPAAPSESATAREAPPATAPAGEPATTPPARELARPSAAPAAGPAGRSVDSPSSREAAPPSGPARLNFGAQPAVDDDLRQLVEPPSATLAAPGTRPRLSFERPAAPRGSGAGLVQLNVAPPAPEPESKLARDIQKAAKPDCRDAYAGLGLLAVPVLIANAITDKGCRW